jgi:hypothetical protein
MSHLVTVEDRRLGLARRVVVVVILAASLGLSATSVWLVRRSKAPVVVAPPLVSHEVDKRQVVARVGDESVTEGELQRYQLTRRLWAGEIGERQALGELCDRILLGFAAREHGLTVGDEEVQREVLRRKLMIGAAAAPFSAQAPSPVAATTSRQGPGALAPPSPAAGLRGPIQGPVPGIRPPEQPGGVGAPARLTPIEAASVTLAENGLTEADVISETRADLLASKVTHQLVYDAIAVSDEDAMAAVRHETTSSGTRNGRPDDTAVEAARQRLRRERGASSLSALLGQLRERHNVDLLPKP